MSDRNGRDGGRVGDATRQRIDQLAGGWKIPRDAGDDGDADRDDAVPVGRAEAEGGRTKRTSAPPPPPGSRPARPSRPPPPPRSDRASSPPPRPDRADSPPPRSDRASSPPPRPDRADSPAPRPPRPSRPSRPPPPPGASRRAEPLPKPARIEPSADRGDETVLDPNAKERAAAAEARVRDVDRPAAEARVRDAERPAASEGRGRDAERPPRSEPPRTPRRGRAEPPATPPRLPDAPVVAPSDDDDAETILMPPNAPSPLAPRPPAAALTGSVRLPEALPREPGVLGDVAYFLRVARRLPAARSELRDIQDELAGERGGRTQRLLEIARNALADADLDTTLVGKAREHLVTLEEMRSRHAGAVAAADEEVATIERERDEAAAERRAAIAELREEIEAVDSSLEPLRRRQAQARRRFTALRRSLDKLDAQIAASEARLVAAEGTADAAGIEAELASTVAERSDVAGEEPEIAAELDDLEPKIASLESSRRDLEERIARLEEEGERAAVRAKEKIAAVVAQKTVEDRAASDLATERQEALRVLGESLSDQRPESLTHRLRAVEEHDLAIATLERRDVEIREQLANIERWAALRGLLWLLLVAGAVAAVLLLVSSR